DEVIECAAIRSLRTRWMNRLPSILRRFLMGVLGSANLIWKLANRCAIFHGVPRPSLYVAPLLGTVLKLINQGDALLGLASINWLKLLLTYCVPYAVCTYGAVSYRLKKADVTLERSA